MKYTISINIEYLCSWTKDHVL